MTNCESPQGAIEEAVCEAQEDEVLEAILRDVRVNTRDELQEERDAGEKISATARLLGIEEWSFLVSYFHISGSNVQVVEQIMSLQRQLGFSGDEIDGVIGASTLRRIYEREYSRNLSQVREIQRARWQTYLEMRDYPSKRRWVGHLRDTVTLHPSSIPNVFDRNYYFGDTDGSPREGTGINEILVPHLSPRIQRQDTVVYMLEVEGKYVIAAYSGGNLVLASYTSPGNPNHRDGQGEATPEGSWSADREGQFSDMHWISGARASVQRSGGRFISDIMPYAINIEGGIFSHAGATNGERRSHGCMRLPLYYARELYLIYQQLGGNMAWEIQTS